MYEKQVFRPTRKDLDGDGKDLVQNVYGKATIGAFDTSIWS